MAIPVFLHDTFYLIENSTIEEIFKILKDEGIKSSTLRGKATYQFPADNFDAFKTIIRKSLEKAQMAFYQVGDSFFARPVTDVESLGYYKANDGKLYTCAEDYRQSSTSIQSPEVGQIDKKIPDPRIKAAGIPNPTRRGGKIFTPWLDAGEQVLVQQPVASARRKVPVRLKSGGGAVVIKKHGILSPVAEAAHADASVITTVIEKQAGGSNQSVALIPVQQFKEEYTDEQTTLIDHASFLDSVLTKCFKIEDYLLPHLTEVQTLMRAMGEEFEKEVKKPTLEAGRMLEYVSGTLPDGKFQYVLGESSKLSDSMVMLPVFSALLGKKNKSLQNKCTVTNLIGSKLARVSIAGVDSNGEFHGFVHFEEITEEAVNNAKNKVEEFLATKGKKLNELTPQEKYELYLKEINSYYINHSDCGKMLLAPGSSAYVDLSKALAVMENEKFSVPEFYDSKQGAITWTSHEVIAFDNRGEKTLSEQVHEFVKPIKVPIAPVTATDAHEHEEAEHVVASPLEFGPSLRIASHNVILLPSSFELSAEQAELEGDVSQTGRALPEDAINGLLRTLVKSQPKSQGQKEGNNAIRPGDRVVVGSVNFSNLPSLYNPIAYKDENGHEWESEEAYKAAMSSIGIAGDLLSDSLPILTTGEDVVVKGK